MNIKSLNVLIYILAVEKAFQHILSAWFFVVDIPGIGTPDIGDTFQISNSTMAILNLVYFLLFVVGIIAKMKDKKWTSPVLILLAFLDIVLEFIFHHFFFITFSVIASTVLILALVLHEKRKNLRKYS